MAKKVVKKQLTKKQLGRTAGGLVMTGGGKGPSGKVAKRRF